MKPPGQEKKESKNKSKKQLEVASISKVQPTCRLDLSSQPRTPRRRPSEHKKNETSNLSCQPKKPRDRLKKKVEHRGVRYKNFLHVSLMIHSLHIRGVEEIVCCKIKISSEEDKVD